MAHLASNALLTAGIYAGRREGSLISDRGPPTVAPTLEHLSDTSRPAVNGHKAVTAQKAAVEYIADADKLVLPLGMFDSTRASEDKRYDRMMAIFAKIGPRLSTKLVEGSLAIVDVGFSVDTTGLVGTQSWATTSIFDPEGDTNDYGNGNFILGLGTSVGLIKEDGSIANRLNDRDAADLILHLKWGPGANDEAKFVSFLEPDELEPSTPVEFDKHPTLVEQVSDFIAKMCGVNMSPVDANRMQSDEMRWSDDECKTDTAEDRFIPKLSPYSTSMIAALNMAAMDGVPRLAWERAYGTSVGAVPDDESIHGREYVLTTVMPEDSEVVAVGESHPLAEKGEKYLRGCLSLLGVFGMLHLANDHSYKRDDESLKRKGSTLIRGCKTTLEQDEIDVLASEVTLPYSTRTCAHPFGLSSTWAISKHGRKWGFLAEPLSIRDSTVPPAYQKMSVVVTEVGKLLSLPVGGKLRASIGDNYDLVSAALANVVLAAPSYSELHKHYGYDSKETVSKQASQLATVLLPLATAHAEVFARNDDGEPIGAALAYCTTKCKETEGSLVDMYFKALAKYVDGATDLSTLLQGGVAPPAPTAPPVKN